METNQDEQIDSVIVQDNGYLEYDMIVLRYCM
jgi:hypothetical protein